MRLEAFILIESARGKAISKEQAIALMRKNCSQALYGYTRGNILYRGVNHNMDEYISYSPVGIRKSRNTQNYYTLLMDNSARWKDYPKRSKSFICSSSFAFAAGFGDVYSVWPYNGAKVGVAPARDLWQSFYDSLHGNSLNGFNHTLGQMLKMSGASFNDTNVTSLIKAMNTLDDKLRKGEIDFNDMVRKLDIGMTWITNSYKNNYHLYEVIDKILDPKTNGFKVVKVGQKYEDGGDSRECWTDSPCIFVRRAAKSSNKDMISPTEDILKELGYGL